jgi:hypothetical protein
VDACEAAQAERAGQPLDAHRLESGGAAVRRSCDSSAEETVIDGSAKKQ